MLVKTNDFFPQAFTGSGNRLDGKLKGIEPSPAPIDPSDIKRFVLYLFQHVNSAGAKLSHGTSNISGK